MYCDRRGNGQKPTRTKTNPDQNQSGQNPGQKPPRTIEIEFVQGTFVRYFCTRPTKNRGGPRCVTYFRGGVPGYVTKCDRGRGSKLAQNSVTYFMDGPMRLPFLRCFDKMWKKAFSGMTQVETKHTHRVVAWSQLKAT